jgi:hypothetical protein
MTQENTGSTNTTNNRKCLTFEEANVVVKVRLERELETETWTSPESMASSPEYHMYIPLGSLPNVPLIIVPCRPDPSRGLSATFTYSSPVSHKHRYLPRIASPGSYAFLGSSQASSRSLSVDPCRLFSPGELTRKTGDQVSEHRRPS